MDWENYKDHGKSTWREYGDDRTTVVFYFSVEVDQVPVGAYRVSGRKGVKRWSVTEDDREARPIGVFPSLAAIRDHFFYQTELKLVVRPYKAEPAHIHREGPALELAHRG